MPVLWSLADDLLTLTFQGQYSFSDIAAAARAGVEAAVGRRVRLLVDSRAAAQLPDRRGVEQRVELLRALAPHLLGPVAILAGNGANYGIARQVGLRIEGESLQVVPFLDLEDARAWLACAGPDRPPEPRAGPG